VHKNSGFLKLVSEMGLHKMKNRKRFAQFEKEIAQMEI